MSGADTARTVVGIIGNVISFGLFASSIPTFVQICKKRSVEEFKPDPYIATVLNCLMWVFFGLPIVHPDSLLVITINGTGLVMELIYLSIFYTFSTWEKRRRIIIALIVEVIFMAIVSFVTLTFFHGTDARSLFVGLLCIVFNIVMYVYPLTIMRKVIKTKSVKYMPFYLSLANFFNGLTWLAYALIPFDPYIAFPNGLGALFGAVQLILYAIYCKTTPKDDDHERPSQVQLSENV